MSDKYGLNGLFNQAGSVDKPRKENQPNSRQVGDSLPNSGLSSPQTEAKSDIWKEKRVDADLPPKTNSDSNRHVLFENQNPTSKTKKLKQRYDGEHVNVRLPKELYEPVSSAANATGVPVKRLVTFILEDWIDQVNTTDQVLDLIQRRTRQLVKSK